MIYVIVSISIRENEQNNSMILSLLYYMKVYSGINNIKQKKEITITTTINSMRLDPMKLLL